MAAASAVRAKPGRARETTPESLLRAAHDLLADPDRWVRGDGRQAVALDAAGERVPAGSRAARPFDALAALLAVRAVTDGATLREVAHLEHAQVVAVLEKAADHVNLAAPSRP